MATGYTGGAARQRRDVARHSLPSTGAGLSPNLQASIRSHPIFVIVPTGKNDVREIEVPRHQAGGFLFETFFRQMGTRIETWGNPQRVSSAKTAGRGERQKLSRSESASNFAHRSGAIIEP
jgi:hypothetical protein